MSGLDSGRSQVAGIVVLILGIALLLSCFVDVSRTVTVIDTAFTVEPGENYGTREGRTGTHYSPPCDSSLTRCVLTGKVSVAGESIYFTVYGRNADAIKNVFVDGDFSFTIDPAQGYFNFSIPPPPYGWNHAYVFTFDNTAGDVESNVEFMLDETLTESTIRLFLRSIGVRRNLLAFYWAISVIIGIFVSLPVACILFLWSLFHEEGNAPLPQASRAVLFVISFCSIFISYLFVRQEYFNALLTAIAGISVGILAGVWIYRSYKKRLTYA